jgi:hypothetical protein
MKPETTSLIVAAISLTSAVLVVFISSTASVWQKRLELKQRRLDYNQETRKHFIAKRLEAAENLVNRYVSVIQQIDSVRILVASINWNDFNQNDSKSIANKTDSLAESTRVIASCLNQPDFKYYLYFDRQIIEQGATQEYLKYLQAEHNLATITSPSEFGTERIRLLVTTYQNAASAYREALANVCSLIRQDVAHYGNLD